METTKKEIKYHQNIIKNVFKKSVSGCNCTQNLNDSTLALDKEELIRIASFKNLPAVKFRLA